MRQVDCKELKEEGLLELSDKLQGKHVALKVIQVEGDSASDLYVRNKKRAALKVGIDFKHILLNDSVTTEEIIDIINTFNDDLETNGIMVQLPLPAHLDENRIINAIDPLKDVDGLTNANLGSIVTNTEGLRPCTAEGVLRIIDKSVGLSNIASKKVTIVGRTTLVGLPLIHMLLRYNVTPTICHSYTEDLAYHTRSADILITAAGAEEFIGKDMVKDGALIIDVSMVKGSDGKFHGDVKKDVNEKAGYLTPVPGGVGQLTVLELMNNTYKAYEMQNRKTLKKGKLLKKI